MLLLDPAGVVIKCGVLFYGRGAYLTCLETQADAFEICFGLKGARFNSDFPLYNFQTFPEENKC